MNQRIIAEQIFLAGVESVLPDRLISQELRLENNSIVVRNLNFPLEKIEKIYVIGAGKGSSKMASAVENILGSRIAGGHVVVKYGHSCNLKYIDVTEAGHPVPDINSYKAAKAIFKIAAMVGRNDLVICLLSGGGSALLADYPEGSSAEEMTLLNNLLVNCGAGISEINAVRKHLSAIKGGQLAKAVYPATLISLILSDVIGDALDIIGSGPTSPDPSTFRQTITVMEKYSLSKQVSASILNYLQEGEKSNHPETPKPGDHIFEKTTNVIIGNNLLALEASERKARELNLNTLIVTDKLQGDIQKVAEYIASVSLKFQERGDVEKPLCLLFGGEPTVKMTGTGLGGRNQHLALLSANLIRNHPGITILSAGTDGTDGPTQAAGAVVDSDTIKDALSKNMFPDKYVEEFDSYNFFKTAGGQVITGPTMTNVMDIIVVIVL
jgi:glycerate 2-kinase